MRKMKDSEIDWVLQIPIHWEEKPNKYVMKKVKEIPFKYSGEDILSLTMNGVIIRDLNAGGKMPTSFEGYQRIKPGNLLMCLFDYDVTPRCIGLIKNDGVTSPAYSQFEMKDSNYAPYYYYYYLMVDFTKELLHLAKNLRHSFTEDQLGMIKVPVPPIDEQKRIADFLDEECSEIDKLSDDIQKEIDKLEEYKRSVITEAVTRGLNDNEKTRPCEIEGIDEVPASWKRIQLEHCADIVRGGSPRPIEYYMSDNDEGLPWIKIGDTIKGKKYIDKVKEKIIRAGLTKTRYVKKGTLLLTNSMSFGEAYILSLDGCIHDGWLAFSNIKRVSIEFLYYFLVSTACKAQFEKASDGGVVQNLNIDKVKHTIIYYPKEEEQSLITAFLNKKCDEIEDLIDVKKQQLEKLLEFKKSLIYEYVTGKKEVQ